MKKLVLAMGLMLIFTLSGCASMHDGQGWEHMGDPETHQDSSPYIFEHDH